MAHHSTQTDVAIVGAGPYGLSLASHLSAAGVDHRIFGKPMQNWRERMPRGMHLKSDGFASTLYHPEAGFTLGDYCQHRNLPYRSTGLPVPLDTFNGYGMDFQARAVPELEPYDVVSIDSCDTWFHLTLGDGERVAAKRVIVATGVSYLEHVAPLLGRLPREFVTHASAHPDPAVFKGREIAVLGAGASALDFAGLAHEAGAAVQVYARTPVIHFHNPPKAHRTWSDRLRAPMTGLGPGWRSWLCTEAPLLFHKMPRDFRLLVVRRHLGAAPGWVIKEKVVGKVPLHLSHSLMGADIRENRVRLQFRTPDGGDHFCVADHVVAGTGYAADLDKLPFLTDSLRARIARVGVAPALDTHFQSSVRGLYFVGPLAAPSFGPLLRFVYGGGFTCRRLMKHLPKAIRSHARAVAIPA
jgi:hypothetical protein